MLSKAAVALLSWLPEFAATETGYLRVFYSFRQQELTTCSEQRLTVHVLYWV